MKVNVLELIGSFHLGGSESQAIQLARGLGALGPFGITLASLDRSGVLLDQIDWIESDGIPEFKLNSFHDLQFLKQVRRAVKFIKTKDIRIIHTHDFYSNIFGMAAGLAAGVTVKIASKRETNSKTAVQMIVERQAFRASHKIVANSESVKQFLIGTGVPGNKIVTIYNGLDLDRYRGNGPADRSQILGQFDIAGVDDFKLVTIVANLRTDIKDHPMFLRMARRVKDAVPDAGFVIAGEGELSSAIRRKALDLGLGDSVFMIGRCERVKDLLAVSDVCVLTSKSEGFSNAILEYMAAGRPVVATRVGGAGEAVVEGETGYLVESGADGAMAERVIQLLIDPEGARRMGEKGQRLAQNQFSLERQVETVADLYDELLSARGEELRRPIKVQ